jgi:hypothetical protein
VSVWRPARCGDGEVLIAKTGQLKVLSQGGQAKISSQKLSGSAEWKAERFFRLTWS